MGRYHHSGHDTGDNSILRNLLTQYEEVAP